MLTPPVAARIFSAVTGYAAVWESRELLILQEIMLHNFRASPIYFVIWCLFQGVLRIYLLFGTT